jgi:hypothetical protein
VTNVTLSLRRPVQDAPDFKRRAGGMHGNFDPTAELDGAGGATVTGWVAWDDIPGEPGACYVRVHVKQTSGQGSPRADGESDSYDRKPKDERVAWTAHATQTGGDALQPGAAEVRGWIEDASDRVYFKWDTTITLGP